MNAYYHKISSNARCHTIVKLHIRYIFVDRISMWYSCSLSATKNLLIFDMKPNYYLVRLTKRTFFLYLETGIFRFIKFCVAYSFVVRPEHQSSSSKPSSSLVDSRRLAWFASSNIPRKYCWPFAFLHAYPALIIIIC